MEPLIGEMWECTSPDIFKLHTALIKDIGPCHVVVESYDKEKKVIQTYRALFYGHFIENFICLY